ECLTEQPLDPVALHRPAHLARDRQPETRLIALTAWEYVQHKLAPRVGASLAKDAVEVGAARQPHSPGPRTSPRQANHQTVRRLRPLSRRRLSVRRPARVRMRARNPCVRARLRFFG